MCNAILAFERVTGKKKKFHLTEISFLMEPGYIYCMAGENGAGKTTLMKYILDEGSRYHGKIYLNGIDIKGNHATVMNQIGFVSEDNQFMEELSCDQNAEILGAFYDDFDMELFASSMKRMDLSCGKTYKNMSRGEKMKFQLAFAIAHKSCLYLLDEATAGMDPVFRIEFFDILRELLKEETCSILMTSHNLSEIEQRTDYVAIMKNGQFSEFVESLEVQNND